MDYHSGKQLFATVFIHIKTSHKKCDCFFKVEVEMICVMLLLSPQI